MSREELVAGYLGGRISRRMFVRGLIATGVSLTAAATYSEVLAGAVSAPGLRRSQARDHYDQYNHYEDPGPEPGPVVAAVTATPRLTG